MIQFPRSGFERNGLLRRLTGEEPKVMCDFAPRQAGLPSEAFAAVGGGRIAYVKAVRSEDVAFICPDAPMLVPGQQVFVLHSADGTPILVTDTREAAVANALSEQLETVSLH
jgi:hypothetical protein